MEERLESHVFKCPKCPQLFKSFYDEIGLEMDCPKCGIVFKIPKLSETVKFETAFDAKQTSLPDDHAKVETESNIPVFECLSEEERKMLNGSSEIVVENLKILTKQNCWEYYIIAALFCNQLENLKQTVLDTSYKQEIQKGWKKNRSAFNNFLKTYTDDLFITFNSLYTLMSNDLSHVLEAEDLSTIFALAKNFDQLIIRLAETHVKIYDEPMPPEAPYLTLQQIIADWVPYCCRSLLGFVDDLQKKCVNLRGPNKLCPQISLISPTYFQFVKIMTELGIGYRDAATIFAKSG